MALGYLNIRVKSAGIKVIPMPSIMMPSDKGSKTLVKINEIIRLSIK
jgi:hypothetical protein